MSEQQFHVVSNHWFSIIDPKGETIAHIKVFPRHGVLFLTDLWVQAEYRGQKLGTKVFEAALAEYGDQDLYAMIQAYQSQPLSDDQLWEWYQRLGFERVEGAPGMIVRKGRKHEPTD